MQRIRDYNPSIKLIVLLRNPIDRAFSHWNMKRDEILGLARLRGRGQTGRKSCPGSIPTAAAQVLLRRARILFEQMERVFKFFPREQVLVIKFDDLRRDYRAVTDAIFYFLGVASFAPQESRRKYHQLCQANVPVGARVSIFNFRK